MTNGAALADVQSAAPARPVPIVRAGVAGLRMPVLFADPEEGEQRTVATASAWAAVPPQQRGAHMSRLPAALGALRARLEPAGLPDFAARLAKNMGARSAGLELQMDLFLGREAPASGAPSWLDISVTYRAWHNDDGEGLECTVSIPVTLLCPCSKKISAHGAHSQRGLIEVRSTPAGAPGSPLNMARRAEAHASSSIYAVLKRADEKLVTERAYETPRFAEDAVRDTAVMLAADGSLTAWSVRALSRESIHNHDVFAETDSRHVGPA